MTLRRRHFCSLALAAATGRGWTQNLADPGPLGPVVEPPRLTPGHVDELLSFSWRFPAPSDAARRHVAALCEGHPWRPCHAVLGISGHETHFTHPAELFAALALVGPGADARVAPLLAEEWKRHAPHAAEGYVFAEGRPRERYHVPPSLVPAGRFVADDLFGLHAAWLWTVRFEARVDDEAWASMSARVAATAAAPEATDATRLNGDVAGLLAAVRLARARGDSTVEKLARSALLPRLQRRIDLECREPRVWSTASRASKPLHAGSFARWLQLTPELGRALALWTRGAAAARVRAACTALPAWWIVGGERLVGGENFTTPLHVPRALWQATAWISPAPADRPPPLVDVPACAADLAFLESTALAPPPRR